VTGARRLLVAAVAALAVPAGAAVLTGSETYDAGSVRGAFLARGVAARPTAMGGAFTAVADDASAGAWNPAGLGQLTAVSAVATWDAAGLGMGAGYLAGAMPALGGVAGVSLTSVTYGSYDKRDDKGNAAGSESLSEMAFGATWAMASPAFLGGRGWIGGGLEVVSDAVGSSLVGVNLGGLVPLGGTLQAGVAIRHLGPASGGFGLPSVATAGVAWAPMALVRVAADAGFGLASGVFTLGVGAEGVPHPMVAIRAGYKLSGDQGITGLAGLSAGLGLRFRGFGLDYAYQPFGDLATSHRIALVYTGQPKAN
jgi:hypothetical protein